jgi:four helix bundle protein
LASLVQQKSFDFALKVIKLYTKLQGHKEYVLSRQLLRSGTSIGANVTEATAGQSRKDFLSKMSIASKEARETEYWLELFKQSELAPVDVSEELCDVEELIRILTSIVKTTGQNPQPQQVLSSKL